MSGGRGASYRWFGWALLAVAVGGLVLRVVYVLVERRDVDFGGDARFYHEGANLLADGKGFISPFAHDAGRVVESAEHPPLYLVFLAIPSALRLTSTLSHLLWSCALGAATIVLVGLIGRAVAGARVGIVAAALLAVYPDAWMADGSLQAETAAMFTTALCVLLAYHCWHRPGWRRFGALGAAIGAAALARSELVLLLAALLLPLALLAPGGDRRLRLRWLGAGALAAVVVVGPWAAYNLTRFREPAALSTQFGALLASANCDTTYYGPQLGYFSIPCAREVDDREFRPGLDQSQQDSIFRREAVGYARAHAGRVPVVVAARVGRVVGLFHPGQQTQIDAFLGPYGVGLTRTALYSFQAVGVLAAAGAFLLRRRRSAPVFPLLAPAGVVLVTVIVTYGLTRFRFAAMPALVVLAAVSIDAVIARVRREGAPAGPGDGSG
ncbi:MAG: glycosyltransferase family 39 protein [Actinomycetota bacterium]|nr:glycosyltransferase family 39 protein [Actinomycetota bacterium]